MPTIFTLSPAMGIKRREAEAQRERRLSGISKEERPFTHWVSGIGTAVVSDLRVLCIFAPLRFNSDSREALAKPQP